MQHPRHRMIWTPLRNYRQGQWVRVDQNKLSLSKQLSLANMKLSLKKSVETYILVKIKVFFLPECSMSQLQPSITSFVYCSGYIPASGAWMYAWYPSSHSWAKSHCIKISLLYLHFQRKGDRKKLPMVSQICSLHTEDCGQRHPTKHVQASD